ncbi:MAG: MIP/aquaporin family protein [Gemmatimonadales bacterium]
MPSLARRAVAEMLGTAFVVFFAAGAIIMNMFPDAGYHIFGIAIVYAVVTALAVSMTMAVSGGHCNPAVTIGLLTARRIAPVDAFVYVLSQLAGALVAAYLVRALLPDNVGHVLAYGTPMLTSTVTFGQGVVLEAIFTFVLMSAFMGTVVAANGPKIGGFGVGLALIPIVMIGAPLTGGVANPARAFGPAIISGSVTAQAVWWIGPVVGAVIAALLWSYVLLRSET